MPLSDRNPFHAPQQAGTWLVLPLMLCGCVAGVETRRPAAHKNGQPAPKRPNVILLMSDDQGWADVGYYGFNKKLKTPNLDRMAREGIRFDRFYSGAPVCSPTRACALTGRHHMRVGVPGANAGRLPDAELTLAEALKQIGYATGHFGKWHLGTLTTKIRESNRGGPRSAKVYAPPWEHGFDVCFSTEAKVPTWDPMKVPAARRGSKAAGAKGKRPGEFYGTHYWQGPDEIVRDNLEGDDSRVIMDRVVPFVAGAVRQGRPFFAVVWFHTPHKPFISGGKYLEMYKDLSVSEQHYFGAITAMDDQVGRLRAKLEELGVAENTMLWFCSDNGPENKTPGSAGPLRGRKRSLYEGGVRVPGLLVWPAKINVDVNEPRVTDVPCVTSDYLPTVLDAVGLKYAGPQPPGPRPLDGISLMPLIEGRMTRRPRPIGFQFKDQVSLVGNRYKIYRSKKRAYELYDLTTDMGERNDLARERPEIVKEMAGTLERWLASCARSRQGADYVRTR